MIKRLLVSFAAISACAVMAAQEFNAVPSAWKWLDARTVAFSYDGSYSDSLAFCMDAGSHARGAVPVSAATLAPWKCGIAAAVNPCYSPDSTKIAFTRDNDLYVYDVDTERETRLTEDGSDVVLNGYASWVYYEEIFGRASNYRAFWWSPDSKRLGFYRFNDSEVPMFPIYSPKGQDGMLRRTHYPKAGEPNPEVRIGMVEVATGDIVWADFDEHEDQYFGTPFWSADGSALYVPREPRVQNTLDLYAVSVADGSKKHVYHEEYPTWLDWIDDMYFGKDGLYMARAFETGWQQIYYLSYDGKTLRRLTDGPNWRVRILRVDEARGDVFFTAERDSRVRSCLYKADRRGEITALTDTSMAVGAVSFSPDGRHFVASLSNYTTPTRIWLCETDKANAAWRTRSEAAAGARSGRRPSGRYASAACLVADARGADYDPSVYALPSLISIKAEDGQDMYASIVYPAGFDPSRKYPVHMEIYGGPDSPYVRDRWRRPSRNYDQWWSSQGIIHIVADSRVAGHTGRAGTDLDHRDLVSTPVADFSAWAEYLKSLPYVDGDRIGVEGFSFGGTMTSMLLLTRSNLFRCGIAGGGVYDWMLYDTHYTERFMDTPANNPEGYERSKVLNYVGEYPVGADADGTVMLRLTHGTGDDNVHMQSTLQLVDELQRQGRQFELMLYPDGMHGYRGAQGRHSLDADHLFWRRYLLGM